MVGEFSSRHFTLHEIGDGVYAVINSVGSWLHTNSGIIDLGGGSLVFDTGTAPQAAQDLMEAAVALTGKTPTYVVNSHWHDDHYWGNQVFTDSLIISSTENRRLMEARGREAHESSYSMAKRMIDPMKQLLESGNEREKGWARIILGYLGGIKEAHATLEITPPELTFAGSLTIHGKKRDAKIIEYKNGHSRSDCVLFLPEDRVLFCGDLCVIGFHPCLDLGDPLNTFNLLEEMNGLEPEVVVPGHGDIGGAEALDDVRVYIQTLKDEVQRVVDGGGSEEDVMAIPIPGRFSDLIGEAMFYQRNLRGLYRILTREEKEP